MEKMVIYGLGLAAVAYISYIVWRGVNGNNGCGCSAGGHCCSNGASGSCCKSKGLPKSSAKA